MKVVVIDGQGGKMGQLIIAALKQKNKDFEIVAVGTNSIATSVMLKAGADAGATGENPVVVNAREADIIVGPIGILAADSLLGEITSAMAVAVGKSPAEKILIPINRCNHTVVGVETLTMSEMVDRAVAAVMEQIQKSTS